MTRIFDRNTNETIATFGTSHSVCLDEAICFVGEIHPENTDENVEIEGCWYYYDDLDVEACHDYE